jgi:hypothetical protein
MDDSELALDALLEIDALLRLLIDDTPAVDATRDVVARTDT